MHKKMEKKSREQYLLVFFLLLIGGICGIRIGRVFDAFEGSGLSVMTFIAVIWLMLFAVYVNVLLLGVIHEAGHLVFGLLTGYRFFSFRIGRLMLLKKKGTFRFCKMSGGNIHCQMCPPDLIDGRIPFALYNLGGFLMNILTVLIFVALRAMCWENMYLSLYMELMIIEGIGISVLYGIAIVNSDVRNTICMYRSKMMMNVFWRQMKIQEKHAEGVRLKDMPEEWFVVPEEWDLKNSVMAINALFYENRLMDEHKFDEAGRLSDKLRSEEVVMPQVAKNLIVCDRLYCELVGDGDEEIIRSLLTKEQKAFMNRMKNLSTVMRTRYAYALLCKKEAGMAAKEKEKFEKWAKDDPYESDIVMERELLQIAEIRWNGGQDHE